MKNFITLLIFATLLNFGFAQGAPTTGPYFGISPVSGASASSVVGPASSTNNAIAIFSGTTGKLLKNSTAIYDETTLSLPNTATGGLRLFQSADQTDWNGFQVALAGGRWGIYSTRSALGPDATGIDIGIIGNGSTESHYYMNRPNQGGQIPAHQIWVTTVTQERQDGVIHMYTANANSLQQASGINRFLSITPEYNTSGTAANVDLFVNRATITSLGSGGQELADLQANSASWYRFSIGNAATTGSFNSSSAIETAAAFTPLFTSQTGTAGWDAFKINATAGGGSGTKNFINFQLGGVTQFSISSQGGIGVKANTNGRAGTFVLVAGTVTVANTSVTANSIINFTLKTAGGTLGAAPQISSTIPGVSFTVTGTGTNTSTYNYTIQEVIP